MITSEEQAALKAASVRRIHRGCRRPLEQPTKRLKRHFTVALGRLPDLMREYELAGW